jgi:hypothetical protein
MKASYKLSLCLIVLCAIAAGIHAGPSKGAAAPPQPQAQQAPPAATSVAAVLDRELTMVEKSLVGLAQAMPDDKYNFTPESLMISGSNFKTVRNFDAQVLHIAGANYFYYGTLTGDKAPDGLMGANIADKYKTKAAAVQVLQDSFAVGHKAIATLTPDNLFEQVAMRRGKETRLFIASFPAIHSFDIYGQMVEYVRMNGIIPPASATPRE